MANAKRIAENLEQLATYSSFEGELTRQTYSSAWEAAALWICKKMEAAGMDWHIDGFGNIIGSYVPKGASGKPFGIGSHLDTVINGGAYDGAVGIIAGIEAVHLLREQAHGFSRPIEVVAFAEEEGGVFGKGCLGSEYMTGHSSLEYIANLTDKNGKTVKQYNEDCSLKKAVFGSDWGWAKDYYAAFWEIHVEQGPVLENTQKTVGIVDGVVGIYRNTVTFTGEENHAGTTEMERRHDALVAASQYILDCFQYGLKRNGELVITNGKIIVHPNQHNVIPGKVSVVTEIRSDKEAKILASSQEIKTIAQRAGYSYGVRAEWSSEAYVKPVQFHQALINLTDKAVKGHDEIIHVYSWAGHDAKLLSLSVPTMMLFVPSHNGISHSPKERSNENDIAASVDILLKILKEAEK